MPYVLEITQLMEKHEVFSFTPRDQEGNETGPEMHFNMTLMRRYLEKHPDRAEILTPCIFRQENYDHIVNNNGIEIPRLERLLERPDKVIEPPIVLKWHDGSVIMADGNHRFVLLWNGGIRTIPCFVVPKEIWEKFTCEQLGDLPIVVGEHPIP